MLSITFLDNLIRVNGANQICKDVFRDLLTIESTNLDLRITKSPLNGHGRGGRGGLGLRGTIALGSWRQGLRGSGNNGPLRTRRGNKNRFHQLSLKWYGGEPLGHASPFL